MSFWEINRKILEQRYAGLLEEITLKKENNPAPEDYLSLEDLKIETASTGEPSLLVKGIHVHSPRDPAREARRAVDAVAGNGPVVILGFGLGYAAQAAAGIGDRPVIIVEKYGNLLLKAFELRDFSDFLLKNRIIFVVGGSGDGVTSALAIADGIASEESSGGRLTPRVIRNRALFDLDKPWYGAVEEKIRIWAMKDEVNTATFKRFGQRWVRNLSRNMSAIRDFPGVSRLAGLAAGEDPLASGCIPVFLAAAGPSLDKTAPLLRDIQRRCVIVSVDTNLRFFLNLGVEPDFVLTVDPQFWNSRHLDRCGGVKTAFIAESAVYPPVLRLPFAKKFLCGSLFPLGEYIEKQVDPKGRLGSGGSVATTAWDFARSLGARDIWIAGLDLSFPELKTHFKGALFEEKSNSLACRFNPAETQAARSLRGGFPFKAPSAGGGEVLTDRRLSLYAAWFENQFRARNQIRCLGLFPDGLAIAGLQAAEARDLLALGDRRDEIDNRLTAAFSRIDAEFHATEESRDRSERYANAVVSLTRGLKNVKSAAVKGAAIAFRALKGSPDQRQRGVILKDLDEINRRIADSEVKEVAGFLFPPGEELEAASSANTGADPFKNYLKSSVKLFSSLAEAADFNLENIRL